MKIDEDIISEKGLIIAGIIIFFLITFIIGLGYVFTKSDIKCKEIIKGKTAEQYKCRELYQAIQLGVKEIPTGAQYEVCTDKSTGKQTQRLLGLNSAFDVAEEYNKRCK